MEKIMTIQLEHEDKKTNHNYYVSLKLPAKDHEIQDACQRARLTGQDAGYLNIHLLDYPMKRELYFKRLDCPTLEEMNFLAKRLVTLGEKELLVYRSILQKVIKQDDDLVSMKDLINCTYGLDTVITVSGVKSDEELGEFVIENELNEDVASIPENALYLIDKKQVGKLQRNSDGGIFWNGNYIVTGSYELKEIYDGAHLPETESEDGYIFRLKIAAPSNKASEGTEGNAQWVSLPVTKEEVERIVKQQGVNLIEECVYLDFESAVHQISGEQFGNMEDFDKLNRLAQIIMCQSSQDQVKFKAVLEAEGPKNLEQILEIAECLSTYQLNENVAQEGDFLLDYLSYHLGDQFDKSWLEGSRSQLWNIESKLLKKLRVSVTSYGAVSGRGRSLYEYISPKDEISKMEVCSEGELKQGNCGIHMGGM